MLELSIAPADARFRPVPGPDHPGVVVWRHIDDELVAYGGRDDQGYWMKVAGVGAFELAPQEPIRAYPEPGAELSLVEDAFRRTVLPMALQVRGGEVLHASAVVGPRGVTAFCAVSETGKSTVAYGLSRRGYELWGDDAVSIELTENGATSSQLEFRLSLRPASAAFFTPEKHQGEDAATETTHPLAAICVLERANVELAKITRLASSDAFPVVLSHAYCFDLEDLERKRRMMESYLKLVEQVDAYEVQLPEGLERLPAALDEIERHVLAG